jgi:hypothetical protein
MLTGLAPVDDGRSFKPLWVRYRHALLSAIVEKAQAPGFGLEKEDRQNLEYRPQTLLTTNYTPCYLEVRLLLNHPQVHTLAQTHSPSCVSQQ